MPIFLRRLPRIVLTFFALATTLFLGSRSNLAAAQQAATSAAPVALAPASPSSPQVMPDGSVNFQLVMPNAAKVELHLEGAARPFPMTKGTDGTWTVSVPKLASEYYSYYFNVDGTDVLDSHNTTIKTSFFSNQNVFLVPGQPAMPWETANVPHGVIHHHYYRSNIVGINSEYYVYTPPGFDPKFREKYPVLYLLHGYSDDPSAWTFMGKANVILDNLIAQNKARPMIVVMPLGYGTMDMISRGWSAWQDPKLIQENFSKFGEALYKEVMPLVKQQYPISEKREDHAIAGLSMGGAESLLVGLNHTDDFAYVAGFSSAVGVGGGDPSGLFPGITPQAAPQINAKLRVLWVACGTDDRLYNPNQQFIAWLKEKGLQPTAVQTPGLHVWMVWRENLSNFLPLLFPAK